VQAQEKSIMNEMKTVGVVQAVRPSLLHKADSVITVGSGRGFVVEHRVYFDFGDGNGYRKLRRNVVVTASHCLPHAPKVMSGVDYQLATYPKLLAPLGEEPSVWSQCLFFDPVADVAVLGEPDDQELPDERDGYHALTGQRKPFATAAPESGEAYMLALDGVTWKPTTLEVHVTIGGNGLSTGATLAGQSGSPVLDGKGRAVALVSVGSEEISNGVRTPMQRWNGPQPMLRLALPPWLLRATKGRSHEAAARVRTPFAR
jgi:hypothetical protein